MSKVVIAGDASGTGTFTISAPNGNTDRTLVLPDEAGTVLTTAGVPASAMPAGSVLQVVSASSGTQVINNTSTYTDTGLTVNITPTSASNKVLIFASVPFQIGSNGGSIQAKFNIVRGTTDLVSNLAVLNISGIVMSANVQKMLFLDSPNTTSSTTYKIQFKELYSSNRYGNTAVMPVWNEAQWGVITVMEIAG